MRILSMAELRAFYNSKVLRLKRAEVLLRDNYDPGGIVKRLTPLGERIESKDEAATDASQ